MSEIDLGAIAGAVQENVELEDEQDALGVDSTQLRLAPCDLCGWPPSFHVVNFKVIGGICVYPGACHEPRKINGNEGENYHHNNSQSS